MGFDISCKLSPMEKICMKCKTFFFVRKIRKKFNMSSAEIEPSMLITGKKKKRSQIINNIY